MYTFFRKGILPFLLIICLLSQNTFAQKLLDPATQQKFVNALPIPGVIDATSGGTHHVSITQFEQDLGLVADGKALKTMVWGYNGTYPGPTFLAKKDVPVKIFWYNNLKNAKGKALDHLLPIDNSIHWALFDKRNWKSLGIPIVTHLHGGHTEAASDGNPEAWYTPDFELKGPNFVKGDFSPYHYDNDQQAATLWYHDHAMGITRLNVYAGLAGFYLLTDDVEQKLKATKKLPADPYDIGLAIQDRMFTSDGQLYIPSDAPGVPFPSILPEFFGNFILVNGKIWPKHEVEPRQYRYRILNGSDSRFYDLTLSDGSGFLQVGSDNGLLAAPVSLNKLVIGPGERKDVIIDFTGMAGKTIIMKNSANTPYPNGDSPNSENEGQIMAFSVKKAFNTSYPLTSVAPHGKLSSVPKPPKPSTAEPRKLILFEGMDEYDRMLPMLGTAEKGAIPWHGAITENPDLNSTEVWEVYNQTPDAHPVHLHLVSFRVLHTQEFTADINPDGVMTNVQLIGQPEAPDPADAGYKDTFPVMPGEMVRLVAKFDRPGLYLWHCHILSHEDHDMMRPYFVGPMEEDAMASVSHGLKAVMPDKSASSAALYQIYPNPFQTSATLRLGAEASGDISIRMYDMKGSLVREVAKEQLITGDRAFTIDGSGLNSGMYICEVNVNGNYYRDRLVISR